MRRALARARDGKPLDQAEATILLHARGADLQALLQHAKRTRDAGLAAAGRPGIITYSRKVFIPLTRLCRDRCGYCTFATVPGRLESPFLSPDEVLDIARRGAALGCKEALFTLGDRPEARWRQARDWLDENGYDDTLSYVRAMAIRVLEETGLLPHLNPGVLTWQDFQRLKPVAPSMGMMLETTVDPPVRDQGRPALRQPGQGSQGQAPRPRGRRAQQRPLHHRHPHRHRRDARRASRLDLRDPQGVPRVRRHPGSHRAELPRQAGHEDARHPRRRTRGPGRHHRGHPPRPRPEGARPGAAQPRRRPAPADPGRGHRRLGRRLAADPGPRQPRTSLAPDRRARPAHRRRRLHAARAAHDLPAVHPRTLAGPPARQARRRARRPGDRARQRGRAARGPAVAGAGRRLGRVVWPHRPARVDRHHRADS